MTSLVVVTGPPGVDTDGVAEALAERLGRAWVSMDAIQDELAEEAEDTPRDWLRLDAEREVKRRLEAFGGAAVLGVHLADDDDADRLGSVLRPWSLDLVEVRCSVPGVEMPPIGAQRTVVLDGTRAPAVGELAAVVRGETPTVRRRRPR
jgi:hypothetical protein